MRILNDICIGIIGGVALVVIVVGVTWYRIKRDLKKYKDSE